MSEEDMQAPFSHYSQRLYQTPATRPQQLVRQTAVPYTPPLSPAPPYELKDASLKLDLQDPPDYSALDKSPPAYTATAKPVGHPQDSLIYCGREARKCRFCCGSQTQIVCSTIFGIFLILAIVFGSIGLAEYKKCRKLDVDNVTPSIITYNPHTYTNLNIQTTGKFWSGKVEIRQRPADSSANAIISIWLANSGQASSSFQVIKDDNYLLSIDGTASSNDNWVWSDYLSPQLECAKARVEVDLPQVWGVPKLILNAKDLDVLVHPNPVAFNQTHFTIATTTGSVQLLDLSVKSIEIDSNLGTIEGKVDSIQETLSATTEYGDIYLAVDVSAEAKSPHINVETSNGKVNLRLGTTFNGQYYVTTDGGHLTLTGTNYTTPAGTDEKSGRVGSGDKGFLTVDTDVGDISLDFHAS